MALHFEVDEYEVGEEHFYDDEGTFGVLAPLDADELDGGW